MKTINKIISVVGLLVFSSVGGAEPQSINSATDLNGLNQLQLDELFTSNTAGPIPDGEGRGTAIFFPGTLLTGPIQTVLSIAWQGKIFDADRGTLVNRLFGVRVVAADVYYGTSWFDGEEAIIVDYAGTVPFAKGGRDELREIAPGIYLGRGYRPSLFGSVFASNFVLEFR